MTAADEPQLVPLPYQGELVEHLREVEPELWAWMSTSGRLRQDSEELRTELLRQTYRLDEQSAPVVAAAASSAATALRLEVPVSVFQAEGDLAPNAALVYVPDQAIVVLSGPIADALEPLELTALFGHELAHHRLWSDGDGSLLVLDRLLDLMVADGASAAVEESARRSSLATELFADRGALLACGDLQVAVATLVKVATGLRSVAPDAFLAQVDEVLGGDPGRSTGTTHPETFLRAAALRDWAEGLDAGSGALALLHGPLELEQLDLIDQRLLRDLTRTAIAGLLAVDWMGTDAVLGAAKGFFPDASWNGATEAGLGSRTLAPSTRRYLAYVLLDLATADPDLDLRPLVEALRVADGVGVRAELDQAIDDELSLTVADHAELERSTPTAAPGSDPVEPVGPTADGGPP
ncbi:MAG: M48 family metalloprotease [Aquihabitans sp.]